ncbi:jg5519 [Pararge aegeria aegeria]|uniref:Jg5519 protein n=1 Tax=Pararge aegeria aegeria TaxID=348720 RepID=A0A8S4SGX4_9NEOP|nr:jg5519 [Pararge aegeria aegeria]
MDQTDGPPGGNWKTIADKQIILYMIGVKTPATTLFRLEHSIATMLLTGRNKHGGSFSPVVQKKTQPPVWKADSAENELAKNSAVALFEDQ